MKLRLLIEAKDKDTVLFVVADSDGNPKIMGEFPRQDSTQNTARAITEFLAGLLGYQKAEAVPATQGGEPWLN